MRGTEGIDGGEPRKLRRTLAVKVEIDWKDTQSRALYQRLRKLSWDAARYANYYAMALYAQQQGWRKASGSEGHDDSNGISKEIRQTYKGSLSGAAYAAVEREVAGAFARDRKRIYAGQPFPQRRPNAALSIRGHKNKSESGVWLEIEDGRYVACLRAESESVFKERLRLPIAKNVRRDEHQSPILDAMVAGTIPVAKANVQLKQHGIILRLVYGLTRELPAMGERVATLGPLTRENRLLLRTELETRDYTSKLAEVLNKKDNWDLIRRRVLAQIGWRHGHARLKRQRLAQLSWEDWLDTYLHTWSKDAVEWCGTQGIGTIRVESIGNGDWPADQLIQKLTYKAAAAGIEVQKGADLTAASGERAAKAVIGKQQRSTKKRREAIRELTHQLT